MQYKEDFKNAVRMTKQLGLKLESPMQYFVDKSIPQEKFTSMIEELVPYLKNNGYLSSSNLNRNCVQVHIAVQCLLKNIFNIDSFLTIGSMHGPDFDYCVMSYEEIKSELKNPKSSQELQAHVWLTLPDGSIFDWTGLAWYFENFGESVPMEDCALHIPVNSEVTAPVYKPFVIGEDYLVATGTIDPR
jgi:hypothetical protein